MDKVSNSDHSELLITQIPDTDPTILRKTPTQLSLITNKLYIIDGKVRSSQVRGEEGRGGGGGGGGEEGQGQGGLLGPLKGSSHHKNNFCLLQISNISLLG